MNKTIIHQYIEKFRGNDLKARCARGSLALGLGSGFSRVLAFVSKVILVRLLLDDEVGLMVILLSFISFFETFAEVGVKKSVVQDKKGASDDYLNTAWWFQGIRSVLLYGVAFAVSPWLSRFYFSDKPDITAIYSVDQLCTLMQVTFLYIIFNGLTSPMLQVLTKDFRFFKKTFLTQGSAVIGILVTIVLAFVIRNVWAAIIGNILGVAVLMAVSFIFCPFRPRLSFDKESFASITRYARGMLGLPVLTFLAFQGDVLVMGKMLPTSSVALYGMALTLANVPRDLFMRIVSPVLLPAFAEKQDNLASVSKAIVQLTKIIAILAVPVAVLGAGCGKTILTIYGPQYAQAALPFGLLCCYMVLMVQSVPQGQVFFGIGQPEKQRLFVVFRVVMLAVVIYPAIKYFGLVGAASSLIFVNLTGLLFQIWLFHKKIGLNLGAYYLSWLPGIWIGVAEGLILLLMRLIGIQNEYLIFGTGTVACAVLIAGAFLYDVHKKKSRRLLNVKIAAEQEIQP